MAKLKLKSLQKRQDKLADPKNQLDYLSNGIFKNGDLPYFKDKIKSSGFEVFKPKPLEIFQINLGYMCNQVCTHCHVDAGPDRKEIMTKETMQLCLDVIEKSGAQTLDLTGGAPEMNPNFRWFVAEASKKGIKDFIVRSNLTIIKANKKYYDLPEFFKKHNIHVVSSMPHWTRGKTDRQRGEGVFNQSIEALKSLNEVGYGMPDSPLKLDLVYNPSGAFMPADQSDLEKDFKKALLDDFGICFHNLMAITNLPISRFLDFLIASDNYEDYMTTLVEAYNPLAVQNVMCRNTLSVGWDGYLYDCDFNQMLDMKVNGKPKHLKDFDLQSLQNRDIRVSQHCYGCTAGAGSSCQGTTT
jgi:radical SAM/Cys-rich protein